MKGLDQEEDFIRTIVRISEIFCRIFYKDFVWYFLRVIPLVFFRKLRQFVRWFVWFTPLFLLAYITWASKIYFFSKWSNLQILRFSFSTGKCINSQLPKQNLNHLIILKPSVSCIGLKKRGWLVILSLSDNLALEIPPCRRGKSVFRLEFRSEQLERTREACREDSARADGSN